MLEVGLVLAGIGVGYAVCAWLTPKSPPITLEHYQLCLDRYLAEHPPFMDESSDILEAPL